LIEWVNLDLLHRDDGFTAENFLILEQQCMVKYDYQPNLRVVRKTGYLAVIWTW